MSATGRRLELADWLALAAVSTLALALGVGRLLLRPELTAGAIDVLFGDTGYNLLVAERLLQGERLYRDVAYQYGPLPPLLHAGLAFLLGNSLRTFHLLLLLVSTVNAALAYLVIRSCASRTAALVVVGLGLSANLLIPGSTLGAISGAAYIPLERTVILLAALAWSPPNVRSPRRGLALGLVVGSWQGVRFGGAAFLTVAILIADLVALRATTGLHRTSVTGWLRGLVWPAAGALLVQLLLTAAALATLPWHVAVDFVWPAYILGSYDSWLDPALRWPQWGGLRLFVGQFLSPVLGLLIGAAAVVWYVVRGRRREGSAVGEARAAEQIRLLVPFLFYAVGVFGFFQMVFHFFQFAWALVFPVAWAFARARRPGRALIVALLLPCFALNARTAWTEADGEEEVLRTPSGDELWASRASRAEIEALEAALRNAAPGSRTTPKVVVFPLGAGFDVAYGAGNDLRQVWMYHGMVRPYDEAELRAAIDELDAIVLHQPHESLRPLDPCSWYRPSVLSPETCAAVAQRLGDPYRVGRFWVLPLSPTPGGRPPARVGIPMTHAAAGASL